MFAVMVEFRKKPMLRLFIAGVLMFCSLMVSANSDRTARDIVRTAIAAAGGEYWQRPKSLYLQGFGLFWREGQVVPRVVEDYRMWRVYDQRRESAHEASGMVRIDAISDGKIWFQQAFDGETSFSHLGVVPEDKAREGWANAFGFGIIRHALDEGFALTRLADDVVDGEPVFSVLLVDLSGQRTVFGIAQSDYRILSVGFGTPKGWHQRVYSNFREQAKPYWRQPGRVRLYYNGVKVNEIHWLHFEVNGDYPRSQFQLKR